jgi:hypothetical protein
MFRDAAGIYGRGVDADPALAATLLGRLHDTQGEASRFAYHLRNRLERSELTRTPSDEGSNEGSNEGSDERYDQLGDVG